MENNSTGRTSYHIHNMSDEEFSLHIQRQNEEKAIEKALVEQKRAEKMAELKKIADFKKELKLMHEEPDFVYANIGLNNPELERRYNEMLLMTVEGKSKLDIIQHGMKQYGLKEKESYMLYFQSMKYMKALSKEAKENIREKHDFIYNSLLKDELAESNDKTNELHDRREARKQAKETMSRIEKLFGVQEKAPTTQNNIQITGDNIEFKLQMPSSSISPKKKDIDIKPTEFDDVTDND